MKADEYDGNIYSPKNGYKQKWEKSEKLSYNLFEKKAT